MTVVLMVFPPGFVDVLERKKISDRKVHQLQRGEVLTKDRRKKAGRKEAMFCR